MEKIAVAAFLVGLAVAVVKQGQPQTVAPALADKAILVVVKTGTMAVVAVVVLPQWVNLRQAQAKRVMVAQAAILCQHGLPPHLLAMAGITQVAAVVATGTPAAKVLAVRVVAEMAPTTTATAAFKRVKLILAAVVVVVLAAIILAEMVARAL